MGTARDPWPQPGKERLGFSLREGFESAACYAIAAAFVWGLIELGAFAFLDGWPSKCRELAPAVATVLVSGRIEWLAAWVKRALLAPSDAAGAAAGHSVVRRTEWDRNNAVGGLALPLLAVGGFVLSVFLIFSTPPYVTGAVVSAGCAVAGSLWIVRHLWLGGVEIQWERGTLAPGRRAVFFVATTDGSSRLLGARFLLRCVGPDRSSVRRKPNPMGLKTIALWQAEVRAAENEAPGPQQFVRIEFDLPAEVPATGTAAARPIVWELIVHGRSTWGDVTEAFEVPVGDVVPVPDGARSSARR